MESGHPIHGLPDCYQDLPREINMSGNM